MTGHIVLNPAYEILTPTGWQDFLGMKRSYRDTIKISFTDGSIFICTANHTFVQNGKNVVASALKPKQRINDKQVVSVMLHHKLDVYDPLNVSGGNLYYSDDLVSHNCSFLGSSNTLISASTISNLSSIPPLFSNDGLDILESPFRGIKETNQPAHIYMMVVDVSRGIGGDYSAFTVIDITQSPYKVVAKYRDNHVSDLLYPNIIHKVATDYNHAYVLIEIKENGQHVADILTDELEYDNVMYVTRGQGGQHITAGFGGRSASVQTGVMTSAQVKRIGCTTLKTLVEESKLLINDVDIISEISTFIETRGSYAADEGYNDDLIMTLVLFAWATTSPYFKDLTNVDIRKKIFQSRMDEINSSMTPFGFHDDGREDKTKEFTDEAGNNWYFDNAKETMDKVGWLFDDYSSKTR